jgi:rare lipoprotein A
MEKTTFKTALFLTVATVSFLVPPQKSKCITAPAAQSPQPSSALAKAVEQIPLETQPAQFERVSFFKRFAPPKPVSIQTGVASWYGGSQRTASGERYKPNEMTAAHRRLPLGTIVRVTNLANNRSTVVRINDRGPYIKGRILDLSVAAARELAMLNSGTTQVRVEVFPPGADQIAL